jgi:hypothetical protein
MPLSRPPDCAIRGIDDTDTFLFAVESNRCGSPYRSLEPKRRYACAPLPEPSPRDPF